MKCHLKQYFIWIFTVCQSTCIPVKNLGPQTRGEGDIIVICSVLCVAVGSGIWVGLNIFYSNWFVHGIYSLKQYDNDKNV